MVDSPLVAPAAPGMPLGDLQYRVAFRTDGWVDCLVLRESERWVGRGLTEGEALDDALSQIFGSAASRALLAKYTVPAAPPSVAPPPAEPEPVAAAPEPEPEPEVAVAATTAETWADDAALNPPPRDAEASFAQALAAIEALRAPAKGAAPDALVDAVTSLAQHVRWVRGRVADAEQWTRALTKLRALAAAMAEHGPAIARILDPRYRPPMPWSALITGVNGAEERRAASEALRESLVESAHDAESLLAWLVPASELFTLRELARLLEPHRRQVADLEGAAATHPDRRLRRKLRDLVKKLGAPTKK
jgi:hypothetical protein